MSCKIKILMYASGSQTDEAKVSHDRICQTRSVKATDVCLYYSTWCFHLIFFRVQLARHTAMQFHIAYSLYFVFAWVRGCISSCFRDSVLIHNLISDRRCRESGHGHITLMGKSHCRSDNNAKRLNEKWKSGHGLSEVNIRSGDLEV